MKTMQERIWEKVIPVPESGCWLWTGATFNHGRPQLRMGNRVVLAARQAYLAFRGQEPGDLCVCHKCDTPECVNPDHLFLGTYADNNRDRDEKGRTVVNRGEDNGCAKISWEQAQQIRAIYASGVPSEAIGPEFGITGRQVRNIVRKKQWRAPGRARQVAA